MTKLKSKPCDRCNDLVDIRYRIQYRPQTDWILVCLNCWQSLSQDNSYYRYGGTWKAKKKDKQSAVIGWRETLILPELNIIRIKAKIDTGARTSSLHAFDCQEFERRGTRMIRFKTYPIQKDQKKNTVAAAKLLEYRQVTNSGGQAQVRPVILTTIKLGEYKWQSEVTLNNREGMGFRMLLGRQAIQDIFLVDPRQSFLQSICH